MYTVMTCQLNTLHSEIPIAYEGHNKPLKIELKLSSQL